MVLISIAYEILIYYFFQLNVCTWYMTEMTETSQ